MAARNIMPDPCLKPESPHGIEAYVKQKASALLGPLFEFNPSDIIDDHETTGLVVYDALTRFLPAQSPQSMFFWRRIGKPFASMLETASFPLEAQVSSLVFVRARLLEMMGPLGGPGGVGSLMTFDGSPVELSWVFPGKGKSCAEGANREIRFAIEPMDPRTGRLLRGGEVLRALTSRVGGMGLVRCETGALEWSDATQSFLLPKTEDGEEEALEDNGSRFFIGFDFAPSGEILLKTYYLPCPRQLSDGLTLTGREPSIGLWDADYRPLRRLLSQLDPAMIEPLELMISYADELEGAYKPRIQILSMDCIRSRDNRLKMYCRPATGSAWADVWRGFTLNGRLAVPKLKKALGQLEVLWNLLFPFAHSRSGHDLDAYARYNRLGELNGHDEVQAHPEHPAGGLLFYYSLVPGTRMVLPKIYLPVSRYCPNDLFIADAVEQFHAIDRQGSMGGFTEREPGWVSREVSAAYDHRRLAEKSGIHTYITFALKKNFSWEVTSYFSPEVWDP